MANNAARSGAEKIEFNSANWPLTHCDAAIFALLRGPFLRRQNRTQFKRAHKVAEYASPAMSKNAIELGSGPRHFKRARTLNLLLVRLHLSACQHLIRMRRNGSARNWGIVLLVRYSVVRYSTRRLPSGDKQTATTLSSALQFVGDAAHFWTARLKTIFCERG